VQTSGAMDINVDGGDAATVEIAVENTLVIGLQLFQVVF